MHLLLTLLGFAVPLAGLTDAEVATAVRGDVVVRTETFTSASGKAAGRGVGAIVIDRGIDIVWATISRYDDKAEYQPRVEEVEVLERLPDRLRVRMVVDASVMTARYTGFYHLDVKAHTVRWRIDPTAKGNTIVDMDGGYWLFEVAPGRTLVVYRTFVDTGRSVPQFIQNYMARKSIPDLLKSIKRRVESGGTYKKG